MNVRTVAEDVGGSRLGEDPPERTLPWLWCGGSIGVASRDLGAVWCIMLIPWPDAPPPADMRAGLAPAIISSGVTPPIDASVDRRRDHRDCERGREGPAGGGPVAKGKGDSATAALPELPRPALDNSRPTTEPRRFRGPRGGEVASFDAVFENGITGGVSVGHCSDSAFGSHEGSPIR